jgi:hypothetical protein
MTIQTRVRLGRNATEEEKTIISTELDKMIDLGVTDKSGNTRVNDNDPVDRVNVRTWTTVNAANTWIDFVQRFHPADAVVAEV